MSRVLILTTDLTNAAPSGRLYAMEAPRWSSAARQITPVDPAPSSGMRRKARPDDPGPLSNEPPMESDVHLAQMLLLLACLKWWWRHRKDVFAAGNLSIYYPVISLETGRPARKKLAFRGPDF